MRTTGISAGRTAISGVPAEVTSKDLASARRASEDSFTPDQPRPPYTTGAQHTAELVSLRQRHTFAIEQGPIDRDHRFRDSGRRRDAQVYYVSVGSSRIEVFEPLDEWKVIGLSYHSISEIAQGLAKLPQPYLDKIRSVELSPHPSTNDRYLSRFYGREHVSYMSAGADGNINIFPLSAAPPLEDLGDSLLHEVGHVWSLQTWGQSERDPRWAPWLEAIKADPYSPSAYADTNALEDVAEALVLYIGTREDLYAHQHYRSLMPRRFAILDQYFSGVQ